MKDANITAYDITTYAGFKKFVTNTLGEDILMKDGYTLHSHFNTIKEGNLYIIGLNPSKDIEGKAVKIQDNLEHINNKGYCGCEDNWSTDSRNYECGKHPIQRNIKKIAEYFSKTNAYSHLKQIVNGEDKSYENVYVTNLIFESSSKSNQEIYEKRCTYWKIHKQILEVIKPKIIIAFGNGETSPYQHLKNIAQELHENKQEEIPDSGHGKIYKCKSFTGKIEGHDTIVIGLPHLSTYSLWTAPKNTKKEAVLKWMVSKSM